MELLPEGVLLEQETYNALISTLRRDCRVLESFRIMDYSLLIGIHNLDVAAKEEVERYIYIITMCFPLLIRGGGVRESLSRMDPIFGVAECYLTGCFWCTQSNKGCS